MPVHPLVRWMIKSFFAWLACSNVREVAIKATKGWKEAQVTVGGVKGEEVYGDTLESKLVPGLFFAGEVLDVDGKCGGWNLQWAWSSGWTAGKHAALYSLQDGK